MHDLAHRFALPALLAAGAAASGSYALLALRAGASPWLEAAACALMAAAAAVLARNAWQEARWDGVLPVRSHD